MSKKGLIVFVVALLAIPVFSLSLTSCTKKQVVEQTAPPADDSQRLYEEELARQRDRFINELIHFDFDKYDIRPDAAAILMDKARFMQQYPECVVVIEGHCDERGTDAYNYALGDRRAKSAQRFMEDQGTPANRMSTVSYGEERPLDPAHNETAWALNRRVQFILQ